jgi:predicted phage terminase large subunit-like protein
MVSAKVYGRKAYVTEVNRTKLDAVMIEGTARRMIAKHGRGAIYSYMSGPEIGTAHYLAGRGIPIEVMPARYGKRTRAQKTIDRNNSGRILFPESAPWVAGFVARLILFTGDESAGDDDEIDALVSACDGGMSSAATIPRTLGAPRIGRY